MLRRVTRAVEPVVQELFRQALRRPVTELDLGHLRTDTDSVRSRTGKVAELKHVGDRATVDGSGQCFLALVAKTTKTDRVEQVHRLADGLHDVRDNIRLSTGKSLESAKSRAALVAGKLLGGIVEAEQLTNRVENLLDETVNVVGTTERRRHDTLLLRRRRRNDPAVGKVVRELTSTLACDNRTRLLLLVLRVVVHRRIQVRREAL